MAQPFIATHDEPGRSFPGRRNRDRYEEHPCTARGEVSGPVSAGCGTLEGMDLGNGWWGIAAILVVGVAVVAYGWLSDRRADRARREALASPPSSGPVPAYLTLDAATHATVAPVLTEAERRALPERLKDASAIAAGRPSDDFVTDPPWTVLRSPAVLVCPAELSDIRDLIPAVTSLEPHRSLVVAALSFDADLLTTLAVNFTQHALVALPITGDDDLLTQICDATRARRVPLADLHAGYLRADSLGTCGLWVSDARRSFVLPPKVSS